MIKQNQKLVPAIVQDYSSKAILMLGYMNIEAINKTLDGPNVWFYSRSRQSLWEKGETSGNNLKFVSMHVDCDQDALLIIAKPIGPTCHTGETSCFEKSEEKSQIRLDTMKNNLKKMINKILKNYKINQMDQDYALWHSYHFFHP